MIKEICTTLKADRAQVIEDIFHAVCQKYGIVTKADMAGFASQICHESGEFTIKTESLRYTTPQRLVDVWPKRFNLDGSGGKLNANDYIKNEQKLASAVYAGRNGNGDAASGDGFTFRGAGFLQLTGREDAQKYANFLQKDLVATMNLVRTDDTYAMDAAAWEYAIKSKLLGQIDIKHITLIVNGGYTGLDERTKYYNKAMAL